LIGNQLGLLAVYEASLYPSSEMKKINFLLNYNTRNISDLHAEPLRLSDAQKNDFNLAVAARVAFVGFLRVGELTDSAADLRNTQVFAATK
jgi:hypothetical protein